MKKAFTLIEVIVVVVILGILISILAPVWFHRHDRCTRNGFTIPCGSIQPTCTRNGVNVPCY